MIALVDTHCHLADPKLHADLDGVLDRAARSGVELIIAVGAIGSIQSDRLTVEIAGKHRNIFAVIGVHPHDAKDCDASRLRELRDLARSPRVVAIGETGLDFHYTRSPPDAQEVSLRRHLELADELGLPIVIHCRDAEARLIEIVQETRLPAAGGIIHCFTGSADAARDFLALGFYISFSGIVTFKNAGVLRDVAGTIPDDRLLIETDAPYLAPVPHRGRRNEPSFVRDTLEVLAQVRRTDPARLAAQIVANARRAFRIAAA